MSLKIEEYPLIKVYDNVFDKEYCELIIETFHNNIEKTYEGRVGIGCRIDSSVKKTKDISLRRVLDITNQKLIESLLGRCFLDYLKYNSGLRELVSFKNPKTNKIKISYKFTEFTMKKYKKNEGFFIAHSDQNFASPLVACPRLLAFVIYLNDVEEGGETEFPTLNIKVKPRTGRVCVFPPFWTHLHKGCIPITNDKYCFATWVREDIEINNSSDSGVLTNILL